MNEMDAETAQFWAKHAAGGPTHVVLAIAVYKEGGFRNGIFSDIEKATAWSDALDDDEYGHVVLSPYVIDVPEFGNVPQSQGQ